MENKGVVTVALKLFIITAVATLCLAAVNNITAPIIEKNSLESETEAKMEVLSAATEFKKMSFSDKDIPEAAQNGVRIEEFNLALAEGNSVGYVITAVSNAGYGGDVKVMIGLDNDHRVVRAKILESSETPGLGGNASKPGFINQFNGKSGGLKVVKGDAGADSEISAIASATITSKAVTSCVNAAVELAESRLEADSAADNVVKADTDTEKSDASEDKNTEEQTGGAE